MRPGWAKGSELSEDFPQMLPILQQVIRTLEEAMKMNVFQGTLTWLKGSWCYRALCARIMLPH